MDSEHINGWPENRRYIHSELKRLSEETCKLRSLIDTNFKEHVELHAKMEAVRNELESTMREKLEKKIDDVRIELVNVRVLAASRGGTYGAIAGIVASVIISVIVYALTGIK